MRWKLPAFILAIAICGLVAGMKPALAQTPDDVAEQAEDDFEFDRACMDDNGRDFCDAAVWADVVMRFGLEPAEAVQSKGIRGIRAFTTDGHGNDLPVVSVLANSFDEWGYPTGDVELDVRWPPYRDADKTAPARLTRKAWFDLYLDAMDLQKLVAASPERQSLRPIAQREPDGTVMISACYHPWVSITESLTADGVARRIRHSCESDVVMHASFDMADSALRGFAVCNHLDPANLGEASEQLLRCLQLEGSDKFAAADVANVLDAAHRGLDGLEPHLAQDVRLTLPGHATVSGPAAVLAGFEDPLLDSLGFYCEHIIGQPGRVVVKGRLEGYTDDGRETADIEIGWTKGGNTWRIKTIVIGAVNLERWIREPGPTP